MNSPYKKQIIGFAAIISIIILDQLSKWAVLEYAFRPLAKPDTQSLGFLSWLMNAPEKFVTVRTEILPFFNFTMVWNHGISFGLFQSGNPWPLIILSCAIASIFVVWLLRAKSWFQTIALAMIIGGAIGNVIDRLRFGAVADFLDFHVAGWHYPAFNIADSGITLGIICLLIDSVYLEQRRNRINITA